MTKLHQMYSEETGNPLTIEWRIYSVPQVRPEAPMDDQPKTYGGRTINVYDAIRQIYNTVMSQHVRNGTACVTDDEGYTHFFGIPDLRIIRQALEGYGIEEEVIRHE